MAGMVWPNQDPPATDVILHVNVPCAGGAPAYLEIDKLSDGAYRATVGTLFEHQEICRTRDLEALVRHANAMPRCRPSDAMSLSDKGYGSACNCDDPHGDAERKLVGLRSVER